MWNWLFWICQIANGSTDIQTYSQKKNNKIAKCEIGSSVFHHKFHFSFSCYFMCLIFDECKDFQEFQSKNIKVVWLVNIFPKTICSVCAVCAQRSAFIIKKLKSTSSQLPAQQKDIPWRSHVNFCTYKSYGNHKNAVQPENSVTSTNNNNNNKLLGKIVWCLS